MVILSYLKTQLKFMIVIESGKMILDKIFILLLIIISIGFAVTGIIISNKIIDKLNNLNKK